VRLLLEVGFKSVLLLINLTAGAGRARPRSQINLRRRRFFGLTPNAGFELRRPHREKSNVLPVRGRKGVESKPGSALNGVATMPQANHSRFYMLWIKLRNLMKTMMKSLQANCGVEN
jgi:hypothetical protein